MQYLTNMYVSYLKTVHNIVVPVINQDKENKNKAILGPLTFVENFKYNIPIKLTK